MSATEIIPIPHDDIAAARRLRTHFAQFWSTETGSPREVYDRFVAATPVADGVEVISPTGGFGNVWVRPTSAGPNGSMLFIHGGGYGLGSAAAYVGLVSQLVSRARLAALVLEYPLAPEARMPEALDLALDTVRSMSGPVVLAGDSAGGGLALAVASRARSLGVDVAAVAVFSPWTDLTLSGPSVGDLAVGDPLLDPDYLRASASAYLGTARADDPRASPLFGDVGELPPTLIQVGTDEILLDDSRRFASAVAARGGTATLEVYQGMHHVFQLNVAELATARAAVDRAAAFLASHLTPLSQ